METKQGDLKDFIVDMEQYTQQKSAQPKELDVSFEALKKVWPEKAELFQEGAGKVSLLCPAVRASTIVVYLT